MTHMPQDTAANAEANEFGYAEHLLVWTWRRIAAGQDGCLLIAREFALACGEDAAEVYATLRTFLRALACTCRRRLRVGSPGSPSLTGDERQLLTLIAAAQAGGAAHFEAHLRWLARDTHREALAIATRALGTALLANDLRLSLPAAAGATVCERIAQPEAGAARARF